MKRKKSAKERGITLVALIITIIVILILVGVTIGQITGSDGIIKRARYSTSEHKQKSAEEKVALLMQEYQYDKMEKGLRGEEYTLKQFLDDNTGKYDKYDLDSNPKTITVDNIDVAIDDNYSVIDNTKKADASDPLKNTDRTVDDLKKDNGDSNKDGKVDTNDDLRGFYIDLNNDGVLTTADDGVIFGDLKVGGTGVYFCHTTEGIPDDEASYWTNIKSTLPEGVTLDNFKSGVYPNMSDEEISKVIPIKSNLQNFIKYTIPTKSTLSTYEIIKDSNGKIKKFDGPFGSRGMLQRKTAATDGDRFYVMALADIGSNMYTWYKNAIAYVTANNPIKNQNIIKKTLNILNENKDEQYKITPVVISLGIIHGLMDDYATYTSTAFGRGKTNTEKMIKRENNNGKDPYDSSNKSDYGELSDTDVWPKIQTQADNGWFVPSRDEWNAFGAFFKVGGEASKQGIDAYTDYYGYNTAYKLSPYYWSSSQSNTYYAWSTSFSGGRMYDYDVDRTNYVRLVATF